MTYVTATVRGHSICCCCWVLRHTGLFFQARHTSSFRACDYCELFTLGKRDLDSVLSKYPYEQERMFKAVTDFHETNNLKQKGIVKNLQQKDRQKNVKLSRMVDLWKTSSSADTSDALSWRVALFTPLSPFQTTWGLVTNPISLTPHPSPSSSLTLPLPPP